MIPSADQKRATGFRYGADGGYTIRTFGGPETRQAGAEGNFSLTFECGTTGTWFLRNDDFGMQFLRHDLYTGSVGKVAIGVLDVPAGYNLLCVNVKGTLMARTGMLGRIVLVPPMSLAFVRESKLLIQAARGDHEAVVLSWPSKATPAFEEWYRGRNGPRTEGNESRLVASKPIYPHFGKAFERFRDVTRAESATTELGVLSFVYEVMGGLLSGADELQLAALPENMPESIIELTKQVRTDPSASWPLREAADRAGYSPFHFSRIFKSMAGFGFHEYVDRCRTEQAARMLVQSEMSVDQVAQKAGFGTTQGLRESIRDYLGLVPSELRALPEIPGPSLLR